MVESITLKPKFTVVYALIIIVTLILLAAAAYLNWTRQMPDGLFTLMVFGVLILAVLALLATFLRYLSLTYIVSEQNIVTNEGIITKSVRTVPIKKIDNVTVRRTLYDLILGTGSILIETPAGPGPEITMHYIDASKLYSVKSMIMDLIGKGEAPPPPPPARPAEVPAAEPKASEFGQPAAEKPKRKGRKR